MATENRIPRVQIHVDNFAEEIKNLTSPEMCMVDGKPLGFFIEVVNAKDGVVAFLFQAKQFNRMDYCDVMDYVKYYDTLVIDQMKYDNWPELRKEYKSIDNIKQKEIRELENIQSWWNDYDLHNIAFFLASYGRSKYPLGLDELFEGKCTDYLDFSWLYNINSLNGLIHYFLDEAIDIINFLLTKQKSDGGIEHFNEFILNSSIDELVDLDLDVISAVAANLFTEDNIYFFIDKVKLIHSRSSNRGHYESILDFLRVYKKEHFPLTKRSPQYQLFGIHRIKQLVSDFPRIMPATKRDYFLDVIDKHGSTIALFFIADARDISDFHYLWEYKGLTNFVAEFDNWIKPNEHWGDVEIHRWLPDRLGQERMKELLNDVGISDIKELALVPLPDGWYDYIYEYSDYGPRESDFDALFLMAYGRLKFPYMLAKEIHDNCELYVRGFVKITNLLYQLRYISKDPKDIGELFNFCVGVFPDKESFREAYINQNNITELINCDPEIFTAIAESILCKENIDLFLNEAHAQNKPELKLFLLDYKNKHFPVDGH
jgi:hypothetical protein